MTSYETSVHIMQKKWRTLYNKEIVYRSLQNIGSFQTGVKPEVANYQLDGKYFCHITVLLQNNRNLLTSML
jgi:hypothetical protein